MSVAVIIAAKDAADTIGRAVTSALLQAEATQVIVVDDGSSDDTLAAARQAGDATGRLDAVRLDVNQGPSVARNAALARVTADWITVLDADDFMDPGRLERLLALAAPDYDFVADDILRVWEGDEDGDRTPMWNAPADAARRDMDLAFFVEANIPAKGQERRELGFIKPIIRTAVLRGLHPVYAPNMRLGEDFDLYGRLLSAGAKARLVEPQGYVAVRREASLSGRHSHLDLRAFRDSTDRLLQQSGLAPAARRALRRQRLSTDKRYQWARLIDAVKHRRWGQAVACFFSHPATSWHLAGCLAEQAYLRSVGRGPR